MYDGKNAWERIGTSLVSMFMYSATPIIVCGKLRGTNPEKLQKIHYCEVCSQTEDILRKNS